MDVKLVTVFLFFLLTLCGKSNSQIFETPSVLQNGDFESTNYNGNWYALGAGCHIASSNDGMQGQHSVHVTGRTQNWQGLAQNANIHGGERYRIIGNVKLLGNANNAMYQEVKLNLACKDQHNKDVYTNIGHTPHVQHGAWYEVGGFLHVATGSHTCHIYFETAAHTDYLVDHVVAQKYNVDSNWKTTAQHNVNKYRKADINLSIVGNKGLNIDSTTVYAELTQTKHEFIIGSAVLAQKIVSSSQHAYQQQFYNTFEWATLENSLKWKPMEPTKDHINYNTPITAIDTLRSHGIKMRCHCAFWSVDQTVQDWIKGLSGTTLKNAIVKRVHDVVGHTKGKCEHWDVNNENLHGDFYEKHTGNSNITMDMFRMIKSADAHPKLFINDYAVLASTDLTVAIRDQGKRFLKAGVPIAGIGLQSHMHNIDVTNIKAQLETIAEAGLPIMITEFAINDRDENSKASKLSDLMLLFLSEPAVEGVIFWGFWDGQLWEQDAALFTGANVTPNAAGRELQNLLHTVYKTHKTVTLHGTTPQHVRGFKGTYTLNVKHNGHVLHTETFTLATSGNTLKIHVNGTSGGSPSVSHVIVG